MTLIATGTAATDSFVSALRAHSQRYHDSHPFHRAMNAGTLNRAQIQGWVANRYCYQEAIPHKDAAILSNCPAPGTRPGASRRGCGWVRRSGWTARPWPASSRSCPGSGSRSTPT